ncbi:TetR/AcrR family transcriptional regulator [Streptomyces sp. NPDC086519]|uniref:TetR/AcrR family transcriptional regulator n=1 Tax=Streptomyces sp. NPDC086519 TaxID=3154863 RepID=UPI0034271A0D
MRRPPRGTRKRDVPLTEAGIYAAALRLIDADGVEALTMRKLATELDANPMSLYHHVPNKEAVLRGVTRMVGAQFRTVTLEEAPWPERIRLLATDFRTLAHRHPELLAYSFSHQPDFIQPDDPFWTALTAVVAAAGVSQPEVTEIAALMVAVVVGVLSAELNGSLQQWASLKAPGPDAGEVGPTDADPGPGEAGQEGPDQDRMFRLVMDTLITGLESRLTAGRDGQDVGRR